MELSTLASELQKRVPHRVLPKQTGKPQFHQIREIQKLLEENAGTIDSDLPNTGEFNHLFLMKSPAEYTALTGKDPVVMPESPDRPVIQNNATAARIAQLDRAYERKKKVYDTTMAMKEFLTNQLTTAFEPKWIQPLRHPVTRQLNHRTISEMFHFFYTRYGKVKSSTVREREDELLTTPVDLDLPIIILFDDIEDFRVLAQSAKVAKSSDQIMDLTITILKNCGCFTNALIAWKNLPQADKTWPRLKTHFDTAHQDLQDVTDLPIGQTPFQQINLLKEQVKQDVTQQLLALQDTIQLAIQNSAYQNNPSNENSDNTAVTELKSFFQEQINNLKAAHHQEVAALRNQLNQVKEKTGGKPSSGKNRFKKKRYDKDVQKEDDAPQVYREGPRVRTVINKYCWTHGASNHNGEECHYPDKNHKKEATFADKMGGSTAFCQFVKNE